MVCIYKGVEECGMGSKRSSERLSQRQHQDRQQGESRV